MKAKIERFIKKLEGEIWPELEAEFGELFSRAFREKMRKDVIIGDVTDCGGNMDGDPEARAETKKSIKRTIANYYEVAKILWPSPRLPRADSDPLKRGKVYRKCFERRFYLVDFVTNRAYKRGTLNDWKRTVAEWNKANHSDQMSLSTLRVEYHRAIQEDALMRQVGLSRRYPFVWYGIQRKKGYAVAAELLGSLFDLDSTGNKLGSDISNLTTDDLMNRKKALEQGLSIWESINKLLMDNLSGDEVALLQQYGFDRQALEKSFKSMQNTSMKKQEEAQHERVNSQQRQS